MGRENRRKGGGCEFDVSTLLIVEDFTPPEESEADAAYKRAVAACDRIVAELEKELRSDDHAED